MSAAALHGRAVTVSVPATTANLGAGFDTLSSVDLATGKATEAAKIAGVTGTVWDIAILPAM